MTGAFTSNERCWDSIAQHYDQCTAISLDEIHYGPLVPGERALNVLGEVGGADVLDLGCGGGHNAVILASQGARVLGIDFSARQLQLASCRARERRQHIAFVQQDMLDLRLPDGSAFDLVLSVFALDFVPDLAPVLQRVAEHLGPRGRFVFSCKHPLAWHPMGPGGDTVMISDYFAERAKESLWHFDGIPPAVSRVYYRPLESWFRHMALAGLQMTRFLELRVVDADSAPYRSPYHMARSALLTRIPYTMLVEARRAPGRLPNVENAGQAIVAGSFRGSTVNSGSERG